MKSKIALIFLLMISCYPLGSMGNSELEDEDRMQAELELLLKKSQETEMVMIETVNSSAQYRFNPNKAQKKKKLSHLEQEDEVSLTMSGVAKPSQESQLILQEMEKMESNNDFKAPKPMESNSPSEYRPRRKRSR